MPALSPTMSQGNVASWQVSEGTEITAGDILADIETDKATLPWENQDDGFIAKLLKPGGSKDIPVGTPLVVLVEEKEHIKDFKDFTPEASSAGADDSAQADQPTGATDMHDSFAQADSWQGIADHYCAQPVTHSPADTHAMIQERYLPVQNGILPSMSPFT